METEWTPDGPHSYYVKLEISTALFANSEKEAIDQFIERYIKEFPSTGWDSYGRVNFTVIPGP